MGLLFFAAAVGAVVGSFLNVCIHRLPSGSSVVWPRSACTHCGRQLTWFENIPILSYIVLGGRCRTCRDRIGVRYPIVELLTAALFAGAWWYYGPGVLLVSRLLFGCALIVLFAIDLEHQLLPNVITLPGVVVGFAFSVLTEPGWRMSILGIALGGGVLYLIAEAYFRIRREEGLGMGDVKMLAMIGAFIGWKLMLLSLLFASFAGSVIGVGMIAVRGGDMRYALPFGTFLAVGAGLAATVGPSVLAWYLRFW